MKKILTIVIEGEFPTLNQYTDAERTHRQIAAKMKAEQTLVVTYATLGVLPITDYPVKVIFHWHRLNQKSDPDNVYFRWPTSFQRPQRRWMETNQRF
jgi:hypothetical protein